MCTCSARQAPVAPGHYQPQAAALETIEARAAGCGVGHLVLVQPSVYSTDNRLMLQMLGRQPGRHRGRGGAGRVGPPRRPAGHA
jgi:predicted TIM-barrel fold metal-dependent hydrolase